MREIITLLTSQKSLNLSPFVAGQRHHNIRQQHCLKRRPCAVDKVTGCENTVRVDLSTKSINDKQIGPLHERTPMSTVYTPLSCSAAGSDHLSLCVYRHLLMPTVREVWRPQRLFHGHFTPCPLPLPPFSSPPCNAVTNCDKLSENPLLPVIYLFLPPVYDDSYC